jgi:DNA mismatch repair protein MSH5
LCLVDEFGKGTSPIDGVALLASTIQHFAEEQTKARIVFVLHFTEVFSPGILSQQTLDKLMCFKMQIYYCEAGAESDAIDQADQVPDEQQKQIDKYGEDCINVPLFNLVLGISPTSEGFACATSAGVDEVVVKRAKHIKNCLVEHKSIDAIVASTKFEIQSQSPSEMRMSTNTLKLLQEFLAVDDYSKNDAKTNAALDKILTML